MTKLPADAPDEWKAAFQSLVDELQRSREEIAALKTARKPRQSYDDRKEAAAEQQREQSRQGREIGELPPVADPERKERCQRSLERFAKEYFPRRFRLDWSDDHLELIAAIETAVFNAGLQAVALPRGTGKTSVVIVSVIWAVVYGHHRYVALVAATNKAAKKLLATVKKELERNPLLGADFPEVCFPIRKLDGITQRINGQRYRGEPTAMKWSQTLAVLPTIEGSVASGSILECAGLQSAVRGMNYTGEDGENLRPTFAVIDDPQTRNSAKSLIQTDEREEIMRGELLYLAGPDERIAAVCPCTVITEDDLAARLLDHERNPEWRGIRRQLLLDFPTDMDIWEGEYFEILSGELLAGGDGAAANDYYLANRARMDAGARVAWEHRKTKREVSALQFAMNCYLTDATSFYAEMQNDPLATLADGDALLTLDPRKLIARSNGRKPGLVPADCNTLTAFIDVQQKALYYGVAAFSQGFTGHLLDYGTWPEQKAHNFTLAKVRYTIGRKYPGGSWEAKLKRALADLTAQLLQTKYEREDGARLPIDRVLIDSGNWAEDIFSFCQTAPGQCMPSKGKGIKASEQPIIEWKKKRGERRGENWQMPPVSGRLCRYVIYDTNYWKTALWHRLTTEPGDRGALLLNAEGRNKSNLRMLCTQMASETGTKTTAADGRRNVWEWKLTPGRENHFLDVAVGLLVAASMQGIRLFERPAARRKRARVYYPNN